MHITKANQDISLHLGRQTIANYLDTTSATPINSDLPQELSHKYGVFVTLKRRAPRPTI